MSWQDTVNETILYALEAILMSISWGSNTDDDIKEIADCSLKQIRIIKKAYKNIRAIEKKDETDRKTT